MTLRATQKYRILGLLASGRHLSKMDLIRRGCGSKPDTRLNELRRDGHAIQDEWVTRGHTRFKRYWMSVGARR